jgi:surfeit locus 1 family protein
VLPPRLVIALATLAAVALTARLGWWQLDRAAQKRAIAAAIAERGALPPLTVLPAAEAASAVLHRRATLAGRWASAHTVYLENRQMGGRPGFYVITPLELADGSAIAVQRGWLPRDLRERARLPTVPSPPGVVELVGRIAPPPARLYEFEAGASGVLRQNLDLGAYARETRLALRPDVSLLQTETSAADGLRRDWPVVDAGLGKHYGYAFQWFGLSALFAGLYVWFQLLRPRRSAARAA